MKARINGIEVEGTVEEIAKLLDAMKEKVEDVKPLPFIPWRIPSDEIDTGTNPKPWRPLTVLATTGVSS